MTGCDMTQSNFLSTTVQKVTLLGAARQELVIFTSYDRTRLGGNVKAYGFGNCDWRVMCQEAGATGKDSSCRDTPPEGPKSLNSIYIVGHS